MYEHNESPLGARERELVERRERVGRETEATITITGGNPPRRPTARSDPSGRRDRILLVTEDTDFRESDILHLTACLDAPSHHP